MYGVHPAFLLSDARFSAIYRVSRSREVGWSDAAARKQKRPRLGGVLGRSWNSLPPESVHTQRSGGGVARIWLGWATVENQETSFTGYFVEDRCLDGTIAGAMAIIQQFAYCGCGVMGKVAGLIEGESSRSLM